MGDASRVGCRESALALKGGGDVGFGNDLHVDALCARTDGGDDAFGLVGAEEEEGLLRWLFEEFEHFVGARLVHQFGQPNDDDFIASLCRNQTHLAEDGFAFVGENLRLLVGNAHALFPHGKVEIGRFEEHLAPLFEPHVAHGACAARAFDGGKYEVEIGMRQCARHGTAVAVAAGLHLSVGLVVLWCFAEQESGKIKGNRHFSASFRACQK